MTETTNVNKLSALVSISSSLVLFSTHCSSAFIPIIPFQLLISKLLSFSILPRAMVCDHLRRTFSSSIHHSWLIFSFKKHFLFLTPTTPHLPEFCLPLPTHWEFFLLCLSESSSFKADVPQGLVFTSLSILSLLSEPGPVTLNIIYMLMTLNFP